MSAIRTLAVAKHPRALSQPFRRTFYSPFAALQLSPLLTNKAPSSATTGSVETAHEHEREHAAQTLHVVSEPNAADFKYGVPAGAYPNATPYHPTTPTVARENVGANQLLHRRERRHALQLCAQGDELARWRREVGLMNVRVSTWKMPSQQQQLASCSPSPLQEFWEEVASLGIREAK